jgi:hypothetical protein
MATSSRQTRIFGLEDWRSLYQTYNQADFQSYNFETLRKSFVDYIRQNYPEDFNDYVESSEFIALLDVIAFMGQSISYRQDLNTRENFLDTAERRDSVVRLADLVSYTPKRNENATGFLKVTSVATTENIVDYNGVNLANVKVRWNDTTNQDWQDQFNTVLNALLVDSQKINNPGRSATVLGIDTDEYTIKLANNLLPVIPFNSNVNGTAMNFEVTSATTANSTGVYEPAPVLNGDFNFLYRNDKQGFASANTGFFFHFKQGTLTNKDFTLNDRIANRSVDVNVEGINNSDIWLYELNKTNGEVISQWEQVENIYAPRSEQSTNTDKKYFSVTSRSNDQVTFNFGDGAFADIPLGFFRTFVRVSNGRDYTINKNDISGVSISVPYISRSNRSETATFTMSLTQNVSNASSKETLEEIKRNAPARFYTQNRMVNGEDYNNYPYTAYSSIIKSKAIARSNIGTSRHLDLVDPTGKYSSINTFNSDGVLYKDSKESTFTFDFDDKNDINDVIRNQVEPILADRSTVHLYYNEFARKSLTAIDISWKQSTTTTNTTTGYFKTSAGSPLAVGSYTTDEREWIAKGALVKFTTPTSDSNGVYYFDANNRLKQKTELDPTDKTEIWTSIKSVILDGTNFGVGNNDDGTGPVVITDFIPTDAVPSEIIPVFNTDLPLDLEQSILEQVELYNDFGLGYNNDTGEWYVITSTNLDKTGDFSLTNAEDISGTGIDASWIIKLTAEDNVYTVTNRELNYYFSSIIESRFYYNGNDKIYDPKTGQVVNDFVNVLKTNTKPNNNTQLNSDIKLDIVDQPVLSDGFVNDYLVEVSYTDNDADNVADNPDFFTDISTTNGQVFFQTTTDADNLERDLPLASGTVEADYNETTDSELVLTSYPENQLFYFANETNKFRKLVDGELTVVTDIVLKTGRQDLQFQYRHNSSETQRINPGLTNIIDLYLVTDSYYSNYKNYIQDTTNTISEPTPPSINELSTAYQGLEDKKMLSDNIVLNTVNFKPLFGSKSSTDLRANIEVVKSPNTIISDSEVKSQVVSTINEYFDIDNWNFGDTFYFSELSAYLHERLGTIIGSVVIVPKDKSKNFGNLYEIRSSANEIFVNALTVNDVIIVKNLSQSTLNG